jgi:hypothetical protein
MKNDLLHGSTAFRRRMKTAMKRAVDDNAAAQAESQRNRFDALRRPVRDGGGLLCLMAVAVVIGLNVSKSSQLDMWGQRFVLSWWTLGMSLTILTRLDLRVFQDGDLFPLALLPLSDGDIVRRQMCRLQREWWKLLLVLGAGTAAGFSINPFSADILLALASAAVCGVQCVAIAFLAVRVPLLSRLLGIGFIVGTLAGWAALSFKTFAPATAKMLNEAGPVLCLLLPTGWAVVPGHEAAAGNHSWLWLFLPVLVVGLWVIRNIGRWLTSELRPRDAFLLQYAAQLPEDVDETAAGEFQQSLNLPAGPGETAIRETVLSREFLRPIRPEPRDPLLRLAWKWWTPRERLVAEWGLAVWPQWLRFLHRAALIIMGTALAALLARAVWPGSMVMVWVFGLGVAALVSLPLAACLSRGLGQRFAGREFVMGLLVMPVTFSEVRRIERKTAYVRTLAALPLAAVAGTLLGWTCDLKIETCVINALKIPFLALALRSVLLAAGVGSGGFHGALRILGAVLVILIGLPLLVGLSIMGFMDEGMFGFCFILLTMAAARAIEEIASACWSRRIFNGTKAGSDAVG